MRVDQETKDETRKRLVAAASELARAGEWAAVTTRDLAAAAGVAHGTFFNYFPTKEALAATLIGDAFDRGRAEFARRDHPGQPLEERLFSYLWQAVRSLRPHRRMLAEVLDAVLGPLAAARLQPSEELRRRHLADLDRLLAEAGRPRPAAVSLHLYWTLFVGVVSFWLRDRSPRQESTLQVVDRAVHLFLASLLADETAPTPEAGDHAP